MLWLSSAQRSHTMLRSPKRVVWQCFAWLPSLLKLVLLAGRHNLSILLVYSQLVRLTWRQVET